MLAEELGYRKEFGFGGALRIAAIAFISFVQILAYQNTRLRSEIASDTPPPDNDPHVQWKVCVCVCVWGGGGGGAHVYVHCFLAKLSGQLTIH